MAKICMYCKVSKDDSEFGTRKKKLKDGSTALYSDCKKCSCIRAKAWAKANPERHALKCHQATRPYLVHKKDYCERCNFIPEDTCQLDVDHIDDNHQNNDPSNLMTLCANCHRLKSKSYWMKDAEKKLSWLQKTGFAAYNSSMQNIYAE